MEWVARGEQAGHYEARRLRDSGSGDLVYYFVKNCFFFIFYYKGGGEREGETG